MQEEFEKIPFYVWLAAVGFVGGLCRYIFSEKNDKKILMATIMLGSILGSSGALIVTSLAESQGMKLGPPAKIIMALLIGGAAVPIYDIGMKLIEKLAMKGATEAENKLTTAQQADEKLNQKIRDAINQIQSQKPTDSPKTDGK